MVSSTADVAINSALQRGIPNSLAMPCERIHAFVHNHKDEVSDALCMCGRSRLGRLVKSLPNGDATVVQRLAQQCLPDGRDALALSAASAAVQHLRSRLYVDACQAADITLILTGVSGPCGDALRLFVKGVEELMDLKTRKEECERLIDLDDNDIKEDTIISKLPSFLSATTCPELNTNSLSVDEFTREFFQKDVPVVLRGIARDWPAFHKWRQMKALIGRFGHRIVPVERVHCEIDEDGIVVHDTMREEFQPLEFVFNEMMSTKHDNNNSNEKESVYLAQHPLFHYIPQLEEDIRVPHFVAAGGRGIHADVVNVWMGTASSGSKLHFDSADNILVQVIGIKTVTLIAPKYSNCLYTSSPTDNVSPVDPLRVTNKNKKCFPRFADVRAATVTLHPGDGLFMPAGYWHWVRADTSSISVNFWF